LGRGFPRTVTAPRPKSSPPGPINRLGELPPWNWQPKLKNWPRDDALHRRRGTLVDDLMKADEKHAPTEATIIESEL
jgi:hypothetical protein